MPSANGVYSLPPGYLAVTGTTIQASQHNPPLEDIASALTARLSRDGSAPMTGAVQFASGTVALPGAVFQADLTSGFYKTTSGIGVAIGGSKVAEFLPGGVSGARFLGELIPYTGTTAPALTVLPAGQTLSRTTYADLWTFAQAEITAGSTLYNNGDGSTTFGVPDMRGRIPVPPDNMGGTSASRINNILNTALGSTGGEQQHTLTASEIPTISGNISGTTVSVYAGGGLNSFNVAGGAGSSLPVGGSITAAGVSGTFSSTNTGAGTHNNVQPSITCNWLLFAGA